MGRMRENSYAYKALIFYTVSAARLEIRRDESQKEKETASRLL